MIEKTWLRKVVRSWQTDLLNHIEYGVRLPELRAGSFSFKDNLTDPILVAALLRYLDAHESLLNGVLAYNIGASDDATLRAGILSEIRESIIERDAAFEDFIVVKRLLGNNAKELEFKVTQVTITEDGLVILT